MKAGFCTAGHHLAPSQFTVLFSEQHSTHLADVALICVENELEVTSCWDWYGM